jgi:hypothetical protein
MLHDELGPDELGLDVVIVIVDQQLEELERRR